MLELSDIKSVAELICDSIAAALERYASISGIVESDMPEHFIVAFVMNDLRAEMTMTMETNSRTLWKWNDAAKMRGDHASLEHEPPQAYLDSCGSRKCDLVVYGSVDRKDEAPFYCLVEFKKGRIDADDIEKLKTWLPYIDTCPFGMVASYCEIPENQSYVDQCEKEAGMSKHLWVVGRTASARDSEGTRQFATFARIIPRGSLCG
jgi:hypothetical protein